MTKTKRNLILVVSLLFAIFTLCSVFAGTSFHTPQTVEATTLTDEQLQYRRDNPGLYETGTITLVKSWAELISGGDITISTSKFEVVNKKLAGDLICGSVEDWLGFDFAFENCTLLTSVDFNAKKTTIIGSAIGMFYGCTGLKSLRMGKIKLHWAAGMIAGLELETLDMSESEWPFSWGMYEQVSSHEFDGMFGVNLEWLKGALTFQEDDCCKRFKAAENNERIEGLYEEDMAGSGMILEYMEKVEGKEGDVVGEAGMQLLTADLMRLTVRKKDCADEKLWEMAGAALKGTGIETIYLPDHAIGWSGDVFEEDIETYSVSLPKGNYVYELNGEKKEITTSYLQGYKELDIADDSLTGLAIFVDTLDAPNSKTGRVEESVPATGVQLDSTTIIVAIAVVGVGVVVVSAMVIRKIIHDKKHKNRKF